MISCATSNHADTDTTAWGREGHSGISIQICWRPGLSAQLTPKGVRDRPLCACMYTVCAGRGAGDRSVQLIVVVQQNRSRQAGRNLRHAWTGPAAQSTCPMWLRKLAPQTGLDRSSVCTYPICRIKVGALLCQKGAHLCECASFAGSMQLCRHLRKRTSGRFSPRSRRPGTAPYMSTYLLLILILILILAIVLARLFCIPALLLLLARVHHGLDKQETARSSDVNAMAATPVGLPFGLALKGAVGLL